MKKATLDEKKEMQKNLKSDITKLEYEYEVLAIAIPGGLN